MRPWGVPAPVATEPRRVRRHTGRAGRRPRRDRTPTPGWPPSGSPVPHRSPRPGPPWRPAGAPASTAGCSSPIATRPGRPTRTASWPGPGRWWWGPWGYRAGRRRRPADARPAPGAAGRDRRPLRPARPLRGHCGPRSTGSPTGLAADGWRAGWWSTTTPWSTGRPPSGPDSAGTGATRLLLLPGLGSWFVLGSVVTDAPLDPTDAAGPVGAGRGVRHLPPLRHGLPDRCPGGRRRARRPTVPGLAASRPRVPSPWSSGPPSAAASTGATTARTVCPVNRTGERRHATGRARGGHHVRRGPPGLLDASDADLLSPTAGGTSPSAIPRYLRRNALVALGNVGDGRRPGHGGHPDPLGAPGTTRCWPSTPGGLPTGSGRSDAGRRARRGPADDPPARHQRLPPQGGRDPGLPVGAVAAAGSRLLRRPDRVVRPDAAGLRRRAGRPRHPHRAGAVPDPRPDPGPRCSADPRGGRAGRAPTWWSSTRPFPSGWSARASGIPYAVLLHGAEVAIPGGSRSAGRCWPTWCATRRWSCRPAGYPAAEARRAVRGRGMPPVVEIPPGRRPRSVRPAGRGRAARARADLGLPRRRTPGGQCQPPRAPQGDGRAHRRRRRCWRPGSPT